MMKNKRGWMLILEATIAVLIVSGVLMSICSKQVDRGINPVDYYDSLQKQILTEISDRSDLRLNVLNIKEENSTDGNFTILNNSIKDKMPTGFDYSIRVCVLGNITDHCNMKASTFIETMDEDIYVKEIVISAEIGNGTGNTYNPKKLKLFMWRN